MSGRLICFFVLLEMLSYTGIAQLGLNNANPDNTSIIDVVSTEKGILIPRMTTNARNAIQSPGESLLVFDTDLSRFYFYEGSNWKALNELERKPNSNNVALPMEDLIINGNLSIAGNISTSKLSVIGFSENALVPTGAIIIWSGTLSSIPVGWALCDGTNGTPDLRERFIVGSGLSDNVTVIGTTSYAPASSNGLNSVMLTAAQTGLRLHSHTVTDGGHLHKILNGRDFAIWIDNEADAGSGSSGFEVHGSLHPKTLDSQATGVSVNSVAASDALQPHENRPPFYALAFIMKLP